MKTFILAVALATSAVAADSSAPPKGSEQIAPGTYRHKDTAGKIWIYRKTPFGFMKAAEGASNKDDSQPSGQASPDQGRTSASGTVSQTPFGESKPAQSATAVKATEEGDSIRFERPSPFGPYKWTKKKSELTPAEQEAWDRAQKQQAAKTTDR